MDKNIDDFNNLTDDEIEFLDNVDVSLNVVFAIILPGLFLLTKLKIIRLILAIVCTVILNICFFQLLLWLESPLLKIGINIYDINENYILLFSKCVAFWFFCFFKFRKLLWTSGYFDNALLEYRKNKLKDIDETVAKPKGKTVKIKNK